MRELSAVGEYEVLVCNGSKTRAIHVAEPSASRSKLFVTAGSGLGRLKYSKCLVCMFAYQQQKCLLACFEAEQSRTGARGRVQHQG